MESFKKLSFKFVVMEKFFECYSVNDSFVKFCNEEFV